MNLLDYAPLVGSGLLTVGIIGGAVITIRRNRSKIGDALHGRHFVNSVNPVEALIKAGVLDEDDPRVQAWRDYCDQPVGEPPEPIHYYESNPGDRAPFARYHSGGLVREGMIRKDEVPARLSGEFIVPISDARRPSSPLPAETGPASPSPSDAGPPFLVERSFDGIMPEQRAQRIRQAYRQAHPEIADEWSRVRSAFEPEVTSDDEGDPLPGALLRQPNIGGEGHPPYEGPHYDTKHDRFVPYDLMRDPPEGAAVHVVGNVACVGPLPEDSTDAE